MTDFKKCIFTICAKNYIGLAQILEQSILKFHKDVKFYIFIADEFTSDDINPVDDNILTAKSILDIDNNLWTEMSFKYDVVEFCTALKPFCFNYILELGFEKAIYLDPDILLFDNIECVFDKLETYSTIVVPHEINLSSDDPQRGGIYNLGFIAINNSEPAIKLMNWWGNRLKKYAFADPVRGYFTDQKWMDKLSVILDSNEYYVYKHLGLNYAPWNFDEREVFSENGKYLVRLKSENTGLNYPLIFFHYSAFKYEELAFGNFKHKVTEMENRETALYELLKFYGEIITKSDFQKYKLLNYSYNYFDNKKTISLSSRRIYARLISENICFENPFDSNADYYKLLKNNSFISKYSLNVERVSVEKISNFDGKIKIIDFITINFIRIFGYDKFSLLARFLIRYLHLYNRARLLGNNYKKINIDSF